MLTDWENNANSGEDLRKLLERWKPLEIDGAKVLIWDYKKRESIAIIYRFVIGRDVNDEVFTIYVGSGDNLSGGEGSTSLVYQYRSGNRRTAIRPMLEKEINKFKNKGYAAWAEIIELDESLKKKRAIIENLAIVKHWLEYIERLKDGAEVPKFLNGKVEKLGEITDLVRRLGFVR